MFNVQSDSRIRADEVHRLKIYGEGDEVGFFTGTIVWDTNTQKTITVLGTASYHIRDDWKNNPTLDNFELNISPRFGGGYIINFLGVK